MGQVKLRAKAFAMERFVKRKVKCWIDHVKRREWMLQLPEDGSLSILCSSALYSSDWLGNPRSSAKTFHNRRRLLFLAVTLIGEPVGTPAGLEVGVGGVARIEAL
jgi:hypothetical protein